MVGMLATGGVVDDAIICREDCDCEFLGWTASGPVLCLEKSCRPAL